VFPGIGETGRVSMDPYSLGMVAISKDSCRGVPGLDPIALEEKRDMTHVS
jgi:hypothetical protein